MMSPSSSQDFHEYFRSALKVMEPARARALARDYTIAEKRRRAVSAAHGVPIPRSLAISVTTRCQLSCPGCPSTVTDPTRRELDTSELRTLIADARAAGVYLFFFLGGEPLLRNDLLEMITEAQDAFFSIYSNGLMLDAKLAAALAKLRNVVFMLSIEGFRESTDRWRGAGTYDMVLDRMALLARHGALFGYSSTVTRLNYEEVVSERFVATMREAGCRVAYYSSYMPVGENAHREFPLTRAERRSFGERIRELERIFDLAIINENIDTDRCTGGSEYLHISPYGDAEPCPAIHLATHNVRQHSLVEIMKGRIMEDMRRIALSLSKTGENCVVRCGLDRRLEKHCGFHVWGKEKCERVAAA